MSGTGSAQSASGGANEQSNWTHDKNNKIIFDYSLLRQMAFDLYVNIKDTHCRKLICFILVAYPVQSIRNAQENPAGAGDSMRHLLRRGLTRADN